MIEEYCRCPGCGVCSSHAKIKAIKLISANKDKIIEQQAAELKALRGFAAAVLEKTLSLTVKNEAYDYGLLNDDYESTPLLTGFKDE
jgi:MinD superfamily P-loop ATPase